MRDEADEQVKIGWRANLKVNSIKQQQQFRIQRAIGLYLIPETSMCHYERIGDFKKLDQHCSVAHKDCTR
jgi:hypothetical protein